MFTLTHEGEKVGTTRLESGDPSIRSASGAFNNVGGAKAMAGFIQSVDGSEDDGVVFVELNSDFTLLDKDGLSIDYQEGNLIAVPTEDEVFLDITGISAKDYDKHFAEHISAMASDSD